MKLNEYQEAALRTDGDLEHYSKSELAHAVNERAEVLANLDGWLSEINDLGKKIDQTKKALVYKKREEPVASYTEEHVNHLRAVHALMLLTSEVGELSEAIVNKDSVNIAEELGDIMWGVSLLAKSQGITLEQCAKANIAKLAKRYPGKFSTDAALNRDKEAEMSAVKEELK